jgi:hypothetical protein
MSARWPGWKRSASRRSSDRVEHWHTCGGDRDRGRRRRSARRRTPDQPARAPLGPRVRVRGNAGDDAALPEPDLGRIRTLDAGPGARLVGLVRVRVGGERTVDELAGAAPVPAAGDGVHLHRRARGPTRVRQRRDVVRVHIRGRPADAPRAVRRRVEAGKRVLVGDRGLLADGRDRHGAADRRFVRARHRPRPPVARRCRDRLRRPGMADARAAPRPSAGRGRPLRRALQPVRDHLPRRVDRGDRRRRPRRGAEHGARRRGLARPADHDRALLSALCVFETTIDRRQEADRPAGAFTSGAL